jgi:RHS repeat-associated protein
MMMKNVIISNMTNAFLIVLIFVLGISTSGNGDQRPVEPLSELMRPFANTVSGTPVPWGPAVVAEQWQSVQPEDANFPVRMHNGALWLPGQTDFHALGSGLDFIFGRTYCSTNRTELDGFGPGWSGFYDIWVQDISESSGGIGKTELHLGNGFIIELWRIASGSDYFRAHGWPFELYLEDGDPDATSAYFLIEFGDGIVWTFERFNFRDNPDSRTRIKSITDRFGNSLTFNYLIPNTIELKSADSNLTHTFEVLRNGDDHITQVRGPVGPDSRTVTYAYTGEYLTSVTYPGGYNILYDYDSDGRLNKITDAKSNELVIVTYNSSDDEVISLDLPDGKISLDYYHSNCDPWRCYSRTVTVNDTLGNVSEYCYQIYDKVADDFDGHALLSVKEYSGRAPDPNSPTTSDTNRPSLPTGNSNEPEYYETTFVYDDLSDDWLDNRLEEMTTPDGTVYTYSYAPSYLWHQRNNLEKIEVTSSDGALHIVKNFIHEISLTPTFLPGARFGEKFIRRETTGPDDTTILLGLTRYFSATPYYTLDGIDYDGLSSYKSATALTASSILSGEDSLATSLLTAADELYSDPSLELLATAESVYEPETLLSTETEVEATAAATDIKDKAEKKEKKEKKVKTNKDVPSSASFDYHESFGYNDNGQMTEHLHPDNDTDGDPVDTIRRLDKYVYTNGYLTTVTIDEGGADLTTTYGPDEVGRVTSIEDPNNNVTSITYDDLDQVIEVVLSAVTGGSPTTRYFYDANGNLEVTEADYFDETGGSPDIFSTVYVYDSRNRTTEIKQETETDWNITRFTYDGNGNQIRVETPMAVAGDEPDNIVEYVYDARDLPVRVTQANTLVTLMDYDAAGRLVRQVEGYGTPEARTWQYAYDGLGHLALAVTPDGLETQYERNALGWVLEESIPGADRLLAQTKYHYDELGRVTMVEVLHKNAHDGDVGDGITKMEYVYTDVGNMSTESIEGGVVTSYAYDTAMRVASVTAASGDVVAYTYDANSNVVMVKETAVNTSGGFEEFYTHYAYDALNRCILLGIDDDDDIIMDKEGPDDNEPIRNTEYAYDSLNRLVTETDALGHVTRNEYDPLGRVISTTYDADGIGAAIAYTYDANGRLKTQSDANTNITRYAYDTLDRLRMITHPDGTTTQYTDYDVLGNLHTAVEPDGLVAHTDYDIMGRPVAQSFEHLAGRVDPGVTTWAYDPLGRVVEAANAVSRVVHTYDTLGNLQSETSEYGGDSRTINHQYDNRSLQMALGVQGSQPLAYTHDAVGRVMGIDQGAANVVAFAYLGGRMTTRHYGNGATATAAYEPTGRRVDEITYSVTGTPINAKSYSWDDVYNLEEDSGVIHTYDNLNRLTTWDDGNVPFSWNYDAAGNRSAYTMTGVDAAMNRYTTVGADTWYYSPWGGLQSIAQTKTYTYDAQNRLKRYTEITPGATASLGNLIPGTPPDWPLKVGDWEWNAGGGYLEETGATTGCLLRTLPAAAPGLTVQYLSTHDPDDPDGDTNTGEFRTDDYPPKFYAQILLAVDGSDAPDYPYLALRITPDQLALLEYNGTKINELDVIAVECAQDTWYTATAAFDDGIVTVTCISEAPGTPMATLSGASELLDTLNNETDTIGFTVGENADYHFRALEYVTAPNTTINDMEWDYDPYGRKIARTEYDGAGAVLSQTRYVYDGWQLVQEIDALTDTVLAEYVYGPGYIDDVIQSSRGGNTYYHHTDQQYSTVAITDASGVVVERYGYDAFGNAAFYEGDGTPLTTGSAINNPILYTGRSWQPELGLYDYRNRQYDPTTGRFTTPDPIGAHGDWNNLGNAYTYVGNNPGSYLDPLGLMEYDLISAPIPGSNARFYAKMLSNRKDPLVRSVKNIAEAYIAFGGGITPLTDFTDSYDPNLPVNAFAHLLGEELNPVNFIIGGSLGHIAGAMFRKGTFITNRVFRNTEGLWVDELGKPLTGTLKHEGSTFNLLEGLADNIAHKADNIAYYSLHKQKLGFGASSRVLAFNLERIGNRRPENYAAHHIVAGSDKRAARARSILAKNGIDINEAANGVFLPQGSIYLNQAGRDHFTVHTKRYYEQVTRELMQAQPNDLRDVLVNIAERLKRGTFPI